MRSVSAAITASTAALLAGLPLVALGSTSADSGLFTSLDANGDGLLTRQEVSDDQRRLFDRIVRRGDQDKDGALSAAEFSTGLTPSVAEKPMEEARSGEYQGANATRLLLLKLDTNGDTRLTRSEAPAELRSIFDRLVERLDRNKDKQLQRAELSRGAPQLARQAQQTAKRLGWNVAVELTRIEAEQGPLAERFEKPFDPAKALADPEQAAMLFRQLDADGDGQLTAAELPDPVKEQVGRLLRRVDRVRSGAVSEQEFLTGAERLTALREMQARNADRKAAAASKKSAGKESTKQKPSDASASPAENDDALQLSRRLVTRQDRNRDGVITRAEARGRLADAFDRVDGNRDGRLNQQELEAAIENLADRLREADKKASERAN